MVDRKINGSSEPSEGVQDFWFEAEKFNAGVKGQLPPVEERVSIEANTSYGRIWKGVNEVSFKELYDGYHNDYYYYNMRLVDPDVTGEFRVNAKAYLQGSTESVTRCTDDDDDCDDYGTATAEAEAKLKWAVVTDPYANLSKQKNCTLCGVERSNTSYSTLQTEWYTMRRTFNLNADEALIVWAQGEDDTGSDISGQDDIYTTTSSSGDLTRLLMAQKVGKGQMYLEVNGTSYTGTSKSNDRRVNLSLFGKSNWTDTNKTIDLDIDETRHMVVEGKYFADSPASRYPESYRWYNKASNTVLVNYTGFESGGQEYFTRKSEIYPRRNNMPSGTYELQVKSSADNYPVDFEQINFTVRKDSYISNGNTVNFRPQYSLGLNSVSVFPPMFHFNYRSTWEECHRPEKSGEGAASSLEPGSAEGVDSRTPVLNVTNYCQSVDNITFRDGSTDTVIKEYENVAYGEALNASTSVSLGDTYSWYVRFCDQGVCYNTEKRQFVVGDSTSEEEELDQNDLSSQGEGLRGVIRDEDFNPTGEDKFTGVKPLSKGFVNKLEEQSDQLEPGMDTAGFNMILTSDSSTVSKWKNSNGSNSSADQWTIAPYRNWSVSSRGNPYPPWGTYFREENMGRDTANDPTVRKTRKAFGNSLAVIAQEDVTENGKLVAQEGAGVWIDPDDIDWTRPGNKYAYDGEESWDKALLDFNMDLTGPDSGLGYDKGDNTQLEKQEQGKVVQADIYYKGENGGS